MADLIRRIRQRKIIQWLVVYVTGAWAVSEVMDTLAVTFLHTPSFRGTLLTIAALGLPVIAVLAWYHGEKGRQRVSGPELAILTTLFLILGAVLTLLRRSPEPARLVEVAGVEPAPAIAVLPSVAAGSDAMEIGEGIVSIVTTGLDAVPGWRAVSARTVRARWSERVADGAAADEATALDIAQATNASYAVLPTTTVLGNTVRVTADVYDLTRSDAAPRTIERSGSADDLLPLSDALAVEILGAVLEGAGQIPDIDLSLTTSKSPEALREFLRGEVLYREFQLEDARDAFNRALEIDPDFARADYRLIEVHNWGVTTSTALKSEHERHALENIDRLTDREALVVRGLTAADLGERVRLLRDAVARYPDDATAWNWLGEALFHGLGALADAHEIDSIFRRAIELDPGRAVLYGHAVGYVFGELADSARAERLVKAFTAAATGVSGVPIGDIDPRAGPIAFAFAFGDPATRSRARQRILDDNRADNVAGVAAHDSGVAAHDLLRFHPRYWDTITLPVLQLLRNRGLNADQRLHVPDTRMRAFEGFVQWRGRVREGLAWIDTVDAGQALSIFEAELMGIAMPVELLHAWYGADRIEPDAGDRIVLPTILAAHENRWADFERGRALLASATASDTTSRARIPLEFVDASAALQRGDAERARHLFEGLTAAGEGKSRLFVWLLGETYMKLGLWADAEHVFRAGGMDGRLRYFSVLPLVRLELARAMDRQGRAAEAIETYNAFERSWANADPELQPLVQEARTAVVRLAPDRR